MRFRKVPCIGMEGSIFCDEIFGAMTLVGYSLVRSVGVSREGRGSERKRKILGLETSVEGPQRGK